MFVCVCVAPTHHHGQDEAAAEQGDREPDGYFDSDGHGADAAVCRAVQAGFLQLADVIPTNWNSQFTVYMLGLPPTAFSGAGHPKEIKYV